VTPADGASPFSGPLRGAIAGRCQSAVRSL
jgi:hypothetical protein